VFQEPTTKVPAEPTITPLPPAFETNWLKSKLAALKAIASLQARLWRTNKKDVKALQVVSTQNFVSLVLERIHFWAVFSGAPNI
jgi:hypothetical protein